ncbi:MAG: elongation factor G [Candidatus Delongbacteria bacterium]|nr:elongation factor G [Candidatus Delongbacteria bacterium]
MKDYSGELIRNIALVSHSGSGKTTMAEALMFAAGASHRLGRVDDGNTISDYNKDEIDRKISINSSMMHLEWNKCKVNIIDNPGYIDFIGDVSESLSVCENAVILIHGVSGIEVGTELVWDLSRENNTRCCFFINQMDKEHVNHQRILDNLKERFDHNVVPIQLPIDPGVNFKGVIDLITQKAYYFERGKGKMEVKEIPAELKDEAEEARTALMESAAECDDSLLEKYLESGELSQDELVKAIRSGILKRTLFPVLFGSAAELVGIQPVLDLLVNQMASPADQTKLKLISKSSGEPQDVEVGSEKPAILFVFKTLSEAHVGEMSFFKVISGSVTNGQDLINMTNDSSERTGQIYYMTGKDRKEVERVGFGDIGALVKLKHTHTNDTLADKKAGYRHPLIQFPEPKIRSAVKALNKGDEDKIAAGFTRMHEEVPTFIYTLDPELKQIIIFGQGELQLEIVCKRVKDRFGVDLELITPKIPYRETIKGKSTIRYRYKKQSGGRGQYGDVQISIAPKPRGEGFEFIDGIVGGVIPGKYVPAVEKGVRETMEDGILAQCKVVDIQVEVNDGSYHPVDSSDMAFKIAGSMALKKAFVEAKPTILEPIYKVDITVPEEFMGDVMGDISSRRGKILGMEARGHFQVIKAQVPLAELYRYSTSLRSMTQGRGIHSQSFSHYEEVPREVMDKIVEENKKEHEEE